MISSQNQWNNHGERLQTHTTTVFNLFWVMARFDVNICLKNKIQQIALENIHPSQDKILQHAKSWAFNLKHSVKHSRYITRPNLTICVDNQHVFLKQKTVFPLQRFYLFVPKSFKLHPTTLKLYQFSFISH